MQAQYVGAKSIARSSFGRDLDPESAYQYLSNSRVLQLTSYSIYVPTLSN